MTPESRMEALRREFRGLLDELTKDGEVDSPSKAVKRRIREIEFEGSLYTLEGNVDTSKLERAFARTMGDAFAKAEAAKSVAGRCLIEKPTGEHSAILTIFKIHGDNSVARSVGLINDQEEMAKEQFWATMTESQKIAYLDEHARGPKADEVRALEDAFEEVDEETLAELNETLKRLRQSL